VTGYDPRRREAAVRLTGDLSPRSGDGLAFCTDEPEEDTGAVVRGNPPARNGTVRLSVPAPVGPGARVFLTRSADLEERAKRVMARPPPQLPLDVTVTWEDGTPCLEGVIVLPDGEPLRVRYRSDLAMEPARSRPLSGEQIAEHLGKTGGTPFAIGE
jgi:putative protease